MNQFHFCVGAGKRFSAQAERAISIIARAHGAKFVAVKMPDGWRHWFSAPNLGEPFDSALSRAVMTDLRSAGWLDDNGLRTKRALQTWPSIEREADSI